MTGPTRGENNVISADEQELSLADLAEAVPALEKMHARLKGGRRQLGKRRSGDKFQLSPSLFVVFADRYRAARNAHKCVDYQRLTTTKNFKNFKGHAEELRAKEPELKVLLKKALAEQREIDAGKPMKNIEALEEEVARLDVQHEEDVAKCNQLEVDIKQQEEQYSLTILKLKGVLRSGNWEATERIERSEGKEQHSQRSGDGSRQVCRTWRRSE
ncbi:hypothetical protein PF006_g30174 [Phytophthora fragariae]|uniref:Uncharacterized protein n=1 Tax=Phytophthora fragariae TaxID=53985 RepID=A0A6A3Q0U0_9STRA|nr:hypothetical protein PF006_g30174 [Phytophthora fragariae]